MDKSAALAYLGQHLKSLADFLCVNHWRFTLRCEPLEGDVYARVIVDVDYDRATILVDHEKHDTDQELLDSLAHELFHVVVAPFEIYVKVATSHIPAGTPSENVEARIRTHCGEQLVRNLERIWQYELRSLYLSRIAAPNPCPSS